MIGWVLLIIAGNTGEAWLQSIACLSRSPITWHGLKEQLVSNFEVHPLLKTARNKCHFTLSLHCRDY